MDRSHAFWMGVQWTQGKRAFRPMARFMDMMQAQVSFLTQPSVIFTSVRPNDVLLQTAAVTEKLPATLVGSIMALMFSVGKSQLCKP
jgi:hypothetical protein